MSAYALILADALYRNLDRLFGGAGQDNPNTEVNELSWMSTHYFVSLQLTQWVGLFLLVAVGIGLGYLAQWLMFYLLRPKEEIAEDDWQERLLELIPRPLRVTITLLAVRLGEPQLGLSSETAATLVVIIEILLIATLTWLAVRALVVGSQFLESYLTRHITDPAERRAIHTQIAVPQVILRWLIIFIGVALILLQFEVVRGIAVTALAGAGVVGIMVGFAAQKTIANILAGLQLALFQPIKIGDVVVVEGEWGTIEDINLTYVVVKIWDLRRLILPVNYFMDHPFENWSKQSAEVMGTVYLQTDFSVPVEEIREELNRITEESDQWDGKVRGVVVTNLTVDSAEIRALVSAEDGSKLWNLRCLVRERLMTWLRERKDHLPRRRLELEQAATDSDNQSTKTATKGKDN